MVGEGEHPAPCLPAGVFPVLGSPFERQCHTFAEIAFKGVDAIILPSFLASWFLSRIQSGAELDASEVWALPS
jgi:hypothetical protein